MSIPKIEISDINKALEYIDQNGVPDHNQSVQYDLVSPEGKKYPPKYVVAVADHFANGSAISTDGFNAVEAKNFLTSQGFTIEERRKKYELTVTAEDITSTDERFSLNNLGDGDNYKPLDVYFERADGSTVRRKYNKGERRNSNQTLPRLAMQIYEKQLSALPVEEKEDFPIMQYSPDQPVIRGIFHSVEEFRKSRNTIEYLTYPYGDGREFVIYCWNIFSTLPFVQECLKRFGNEGDKFVLIYRDKTEKELNSHKKDEGTIENATAEWFPSMDEYNPGISTEKWEELLKDQDVFNKQSLEIMYRFLDNGGQGTCSELAQKYGESANFYNSGSQALARRVAKAAECALLQDDGKESYWPVLYIGRYTTGEESGVYLWKLRDELRQALDGFDMSQVRLYSNQGEYINPYSNILIESKNMILRGAPGTGKSYLARQIATDIVSDGYFDDYTQLSEEQKQQIEFVQFHPSYDYTDFVEGLRPVPDEDGGSGMKFELRDGIFKRFVARARENYENSQKSAETLKKERTAKEALEDFFSSIDLGNTKFKTVSGNEFTITKVDEDHIYLYIPENPVVNKLTISIHELEAMLASGQEFTKIKDITNFFGKTFATQGYSYDFAIYKELKKALKNTDAVSAPEKLKKYVFIIDEINRGEISKIFGELFFSIDPGYRGRTGEVSTQYSNLHDNPNDKFYIPENVYIIGTMNDIDRSVDTFDFAMRRRFRFIELKADEHTEMLSDLDDKVREDAIKRMSDLNKEIAETPDLNENYQIGAAYFLKLKTLSTDKLWTDYLEPLLQSYVQGMYDEAGIMSRFAKAYGYEKPEKDTADEADEG